MYGGSACSPLERICLLCLAHHRGEGEYDFVAFVPQDDAGCDIEEKPNWLFAERGKIFRNMARELCFYAPEGLEAGTKYRIRVSTTFVSTRITRKAALVKLCLRCPRN